MTLDYRMERWIRTGSRGISSETIFEVLSGNLILPECLVGGRPQDPSDFKRCSLLLATIPEWGDRLQEVADKYPSWQLLVTHWGELEALLIEELDNGDGRAPRLYRRMKELLACGDLEVSL